MSISQAQVGEVWGGGTMFQTEKKNNIYKYSEVKGGGHI